MIQQIETVEDVMTFIEQIAGEIKDFHPMDDFTDYVDPITWQPRYTKEEATLRNKLLNRCLDILAPVNADFYTFMLDVYEMVSDRLLLSPVNPAVS